MLNSLFNEAQACVSDRASERDTDTERSMKAAVDAFNGLYGTSLTETQGWVFMLLLKLSRSKSGKYRRDDWVDAVAYSALAGECEGLHNPLN